jgi:hypothetical protein
VEIKIAMTKTFSNFDKFGLEPFADKLTTYLQVESKFVDESFVLSLNSEFGSGKSTFFEMWANKLKTASDKFEVVYINAWESDFQGDSLLAIVSCLLDILKPSKDIEPIKETAGKLCKFSLSIGNDVVQRFTGIDVIKAGQYAESKDGIAQPEMGHACFQLYQERHDLFEKLKTLLRDLTSKSEYPILIIIDELDRCRPNYAIDFLETIKHFFNISGLIFVLGVDRNQLASSARALFGQELVFDEYYRKFAHRNVNLPVKSQPMTEQFCRKLVSEYLSEKAFEKRSRFSYAQHDNFRIDNIVEICIAFSLNARQIHEFFRITAHVLSSVKQLNTNILWGWHIGAFFMTALSIKNHDLYDQIGKSEISLSEFTIFLKKLSLFNSIGKGDRNPFWWALLLYLGVFSDQPSNKLEQEFQKLGVWDPSSEKERTFEDELKRAHKAFSHWDRDHNKPVFSEIYKILEGLRTFAER